MEHRNFSGLKLQDWKLVDKSEWSYTKSAKVVKNCMQMFNCFSVQEGVGKT